MKRLVTWSAAGPVLAYLLSALLVLSVVDAFVIAHDAIDTRNRTAAAASRRIDQLQHEISYLQTRLRNTAARDGRERGRLEDAIQALATQIRQAGGQPVTTGQPPAPTPGPSRTASPQPHPQRSPSPRPTSTPSPSPTCTVTVSAANHSLCIHTLGKGHDQPRRPATVPLPSVPSWSLPRLYVAVTAYRLFLCL